MREQSAWLLPATPRARREEETVGAARRGPAATAAAAASERGPCSRAPERSPQPRPPLLTPPPALGPLQQSAGSAAAEGARGRSPELAPSAQSQSRRRAEGPAATGDSLPPGAVATAGPAPAPGLPEGACGAGRPARPALLRPADPVPALSPRRCPSGGWTDYCSSCQQPADWETKPSFGLFNP